MICAGLAAVWESIKSTPWTACVFLRITSAKLWQFWRGPRAFFFIFWIREYFMKKRAFSLRILCDFAKFCEKILKSWKFSRFSSFGMKIFGESSSLDDEKDVFIEILTKKHCVFQKYEAMSGENMYISILGWRLRRQNLLQFLVFFYINPLDFMISMKKWFSFGKGMEHRNPEKISGCFLCSLILPKRMKNFEKRFEN